MVARFAAVVQQLSVELGRLDADLRLSYAGASSFADPSQQDLADYCHRVAYTVFACTLQLAAGGPQPDDLEAERAPGGGQVAVAVETSLAARAFIACPELLGRHVPALLRFVSRHLSRLLLLYDEDQERVADDAATTACTRALFGLASLARDSLGINATAWQDGLPSNQLKQLMRSVAGPEMLGALAAAADALGPALSVLSRGDPGCLPWGQQHSAWQRATKAALALACSFAHITAALRCGCEAGATVRPAVLVLAGSLQQSSLAEATCRMLLAAPQCLLRADPTQALPLAGSTATGLWATAEDKVLYGLRSMAHTACDSDAGAGANAVPAALTGALAGPAVQRFIRTMAVATLSCAPALEDVPQGRSGELLSLLPSTADALALLLADGGTPPLPPDLQPLHQGLAPTRSSDSPSDAPGNLGMALSEWLREWHSRVHSVLALWLARR